MGDESAYNRWDSGDSLKPLYGETQDHTDRYSRMHLALWIIYLQDTQVFLTVWKHRKKEAARAAEARLLVAE